MNEQRRDNDDTRPDTNETVDRLTIAEAAERLGLSVDAVRMRVRRGTLPSDEVDGKKVVLLARRDRDASRLDVDEATSRQRDEQAEQRRDTAELVEQLRSEVVYLRQTLDAEIESRRRADHLVAGMIEERRDLMSRIAALTAGDGERPTEQRRDGDETIDSAVDASVTQKQAPQRDAGRETTNMTLSQPREPLEPVSDRLALRWRRWWRQITGGG
jgi:excisionase family DNA binding protein